MMTLAKNMNIILLDFSHFVHLKRMHPSVFNEYVKYKDSSEPKLKRQRQPQLPFPVTRESSYKSKSERLIVKFIINTMSPLSLVEHPDFVALVKGSLKLDTTIIMYHVIERTGL